MIVYSKPNLTLTYWSQGKNKELNKMGCVKIGQVISVTKEGKRYYLRSMVDNETINITRKIFYTEPPKINLLSINHTLEHLRQVEEHLQDEPKKVKISSGSEKRTETCIFKKKSQPQILMYSDQTGA